MARLVADLLIGERDLPSQMKTQEVSIFIEKALPNPADGKQVGVELPRRQGQCQYDDDGDDDDDDDHDDDDNIATAFAGLDGFGPGIQHLDGRDLRPPGSRLSPPIPSPGSLRQCGQRRRRRRALERLPSRGSNLEERGSSLPRSRGEQ